MMIWDMGRGVCCWRFAVRCWRFAVGGSLLAVRCWLLAVGCWRFAVRCWLLAVRGSLLAVRGSRFAVRCSRFAVRCSLLAVGGSLLAVGCWLLAGGKMVGRGKESGEWGVGSVWGRLKAGLQCGGLGCLESLWRFPSLDGRSALGLAGVVVLQGLLEADEAADQGVVA
jgi:hypothetical protein